LPLASVLARVGLSVVSHHDCERPQAVHNARGRRVIREHFIQPTIGHRTPVEISADQRHAARRLVRRSARQIEAPESKILGSSISGPETFYLLLALSMKAIVGDATLFWNVIHETVTVP
jgi:hypothetical protein